MVVFLWELGGQRWVSRLCPRSRLVWEGDWCDFQALPWEVVCCRGTPVGEWRSASSVVA